MGFSLHVPRPLRAALALMVLVALAGATYQGVTTSLERRRFPHPGRMVDVGGHQLHIHCTGKSAPVVVLDAPASGLSVSWTLVQTQIAPMARVCSYDRAGLGWSERGDDAYDPERTPAELRALLDAARERAPFVIVGDGLGAAFAHAFAARFPDVTAAVVLLDPPSHDHPSADRRSLGRVPNAMPWLARLGLLRAVDVGPSGGGDPGPVLRAFMNRPDHLTRAALELSTWDDAVRLAASGPPVSRAIPTLEAPLPEPLTDERGAAAAVQAIHDALAQARRAR